MDNRVINVTELPALAEELIEVFRNYFKPSRDHSLASQINLTFGDVFTVKSLYQTGGLYIALVCLLTGYYQESSYTLKIDNFIKNINTIRDKNLYECQEEIPLILTNLTDLLPHKQD